MVNFPPLSPSAGWMARWLESFITDEDFTLAVTSANKYNKTTKDFGRFSILTKQQEPLRLSVAVEGGGRQLRDADKLNLLALSEHGEWRKIHLGALEANLGSLPYYRHLEARISDIFRDHSLRLLSEFNTAIFREISTFLLDTVKPDELKIYFTDTTLRSRGEEIAGKIDPDISVIQYVAELGKETVLGLLALSCGK